MLQIDESKAKRAFKALYKHEKTRQTNGIQWIWLMINTFNPVDLGKGRPTRVPLKHAIQSANTRRCLFTKDPQRTYKDLLVSKKIKGIHKVISISKLKKEYTAEAKQQLFSEFDVFMADQPVLTSLPNLLGRQWYKKRKEPIPVDLTKKDIQKEIRKAAKSTYMNFHTGSCCAIKLASTEHNMIQAYENLIESIETIVKTVPGGAENIRSLQVKTAESTSLPVYEAEALDENENEERDSDSEEEEEEKE
ncbi:hypothetical protein EC973_008251 [Apophysomyces ossiformis]|uniref:Ribosomal protein L1 n=1 Tax=Apophysomyces ossiformis TaxID=679940 RepID=A0A8H7BZ23_9FUNG|nr:hypothetical protein EC973_008251 [Apophysomyces ossiformis]